MSDTTRHPPAESPDHSADYRVAVFATPWNRDELSELLQRRLYLHPTDAHIHVHNVPGLLPDQLTREFAESLAAEIAALGLACSVFQQRDIPDLQSARAIHHARCGDAVLEVLDLQGETEFVVPWQEIELLSVGDVPGEAAHHFQSPVIESLHAAPTPALTPITTPATTGPEAWISTAAAGRLLRIEHEQMNYEGLGVRKTLSASQNFRTFIGDIASRVPQAYLPPATRAYFEHGLVRHFLFDTREEFQRYTQFHILLCHRMHASGGE